ncbi:TPA: alpha family phenol-soluble modulin [Staphylococcus aureus]
MGIIAGIIKGLIEKFTGK